MEFEHLHRKSRCEMLIIVMTSLSLARVFLCLFTFTLFSASRWLAEIWQLSRREPQGNWSWSSNCRDVVASSWLSKPFFRAEVKMTLGLVHASYSLPYMHIFLCLFVAHSFIHYLTHSFVYSVLNSLFLPSLIRWFVCLFIHSLVRSFFHSLIRFSFVRSFIHSLTNS